MAIHGHTYVGGTGDNGTYRRIYSVDPKITFDGPLDGYDRKVNFYTLDARAISLDASLPEPQIIFKGDVDKKTALARVIAITATLKGLLPSDFGDHYVANDNFQLTYETPSSSNSGSIIFEAAPPKNPSDLVAGSISGIKDDKSSNLISELVKLRHTSQVSAADAMELVMDQRAGQSPSVEVGDLILVDCASVEDGRCMPDATAK